MSETSHLAGAEQDSPRAFMRLAAALAVGTIACVGNWSVVVSLPTIQSEFGLDRAGASLPYTLAMIGFAFGNMLMGRVADRFGIVTPILASAALLAAGYALSAEATSVQSYALAHLFLVGFGAAAGFGPLIADLSHWFTRWRGLAVVVAACGSYTSGALWPPLIQHLIATQGWRTTHLIIAAIVVVTLPPLCLAFRGKPRPRAMAAQAAASEAARRALGVSPGALQAVLVLAGFSCCVAMAMPQVHIVAYCGDLGYGVARGAEMLSVMLGLGVISRIGSGLVADRIGGPKTLLLSSFMQGLALFLYLWFDGLSSLFVISGIFGLFQGGIVPMYALVIRAFLPPNEAGARIGLVMMATVLGMAVGGWMSGVIFDLTGSYRMAFLNGLFWNMINLSLAAWLYFRAGGARPALAT